MYIGRPRWQLKQLETRWENSWASKRRQRGLYPIKSQQWEVRDTEAKKGRSCSLLLLLKNVSSGRSRFRLQTTPFQVRSRTQVLYPLSLLLSKLPIFILCLWVFFQFLNYNKKLFPKKIKITLFNNYLMRRVFVSSMWYKQPISQITFPGVSNPFSRLEIYQLTAVF